MGCGAPAKQEPPAAEKPPPAAAPSDADPVWSALEGELREAFHKYDKSGDGKLNKREFALAFRFYLVDDTILQELGERDLPPRRTYDGTNIKFTPMSKEELKALWDRMDADGDKLIELEEFLSHYKKYHFISWVEEFVICGQMACKDIPTALKASQADAAVQVEKEPRAPRMAIMGTATGEPPPEAKDAVFWLAEFECFDAWDGPEHKEREGNKEFTQTLFGTGKGGVPPQDMAGSYTGSAWHVEKPGSGTGDVFAVLVRVKAKDAGSADQIVELIKAHGPLQLRAEAGALRYTLMRTANMVGPLAKDDVTVQWIEVFKTAEDYAKHKETVHEKDINSKIKDLSDASQEMLVFEFAETKHFAK